MVTFTSSHVTLGSVKDVVSGNLATLSSGSHRHEHAMTTIGRNAELKLSAPSAAEDDDDNFLLHINGEF